jgi:RNA processing factor Prp31
MQTNIIRKNKRKVSNITPDSDISLTRTYKRFASPYSRRRYSRSFALESWDKKLGSPVYKRIKNLHPALNEETSTDSSIFKAVDVARQAVLKEVLTNSNRYLRKLAINHFNEDSLLVNSAKLYHINCLINELRNSNRSFNSEYDCCVELTEIVKKDSNYANLVIEVFTEETINKKNDYFIGTEKIFEIISEANLNQQQKNYVVYGILLHKLQSSQDRAVRWHTFESTGHSGYC